jgi:hypothetical protein
MRPRADSGLRSQLLLLAAVTSLGLFLLEGRLGFNLWDEGYLWYGVQRVLAGEVPIRDFSSYDPGRYYWSALWMGAAGRGDVVALRATLALFEVAGLYLALVTVARGDRARSRWWWLLAAVAFAAWMAPRQRVFDSTAAILLLAALTSLIESPSRRRWFLAGVAVGVAAVFNRNHGVYGTVGTLLVGAFLARARGVRGLGPRLPRALAAWGGGVVVGFLPVLLSIALIPRYAAAFWESVRYQLALGTSNLAIAIPWPWRPPSEDLAGAGVPGHQIVLGGFFIAVLAFAILGPASMLRRRSAPAVPALMASAALALPYAHYAFSRADLEHLALGIYPLLLAAFAVGAGLPARLRWPGAALLCAASVLVMLPHHDAWTCRPSRRCVTVNVAGSALSVGHAVAGDLALLGRLVADFAPGDRTFLVAPIWPGAYAAFERRAPLWDPYPLFPATPAEESAEIERLEAADPGFALIWDGALDGHDDRRFSLTHPLISAWVREHFEPLLDYTSDGRFLLYRRWRAPR